MAQTFYKYQGTGNDFIIIDNRLLKFDKNNTKHITGLCDRRFGIGADGLILLENHDELDFKMIYFNADGNESSMCGNGGRCITAFAKQLGIIEKTTSFEAIDGIHDAVIEDDMVSLQMQNVANVLVTKGGLFLDTGSPHHVQIEHRVDHLNVDKLGAEIRFSGLYGEAGSNVNFVEQLDDTTFKMRTYERGVEAETLSCGTGVTAAAIAMYHSNKSSEENITIKTKGGNLNVSFKKTDNGFENIWLTGKATFVFKGELS
ncbi:diaminopimelate epimerase [Ichthyenterobacterium sp. W332]|uniref:Diaminopimelate epimerase n=1 Tax=Microcosmobacter mediterraneus TaxID=3075607 RepID=A0ABU2YH65_9FLAO|nr:diaminopimelate epimerase [Ichthyenterobacterium sp. W332]MDT0557511.1 diaminopimelate epimerase [Ichthyenterobacterium sp. W332]